MKHETKPSNTAMHEALRRAALKSVKGKPQVSHVESRILSKGRASR